MLLGALLLILAWAAWPLVRGFRLHGDDFGPVLNSSPPYFQITDWSTWFTEGWSDYFVNYIGWPALGTDFVRPVVNLGLHVQGMLAGYLGDPAYLMGNYLAVFGTVLLTDSLVRRHTDAGTMVRVLVSLSVGLSPVWHPALTEASFSTNAYACFFAVASLVLLNPQEGVPRGWRLWACVALQILALWSHETAVVVPLASMALLYALAPRRPGTRELAAFLVPVAVLALSRIVVSGQGGMYALKPVPWLTTLKLLAAYLFGPPIPFELTGLDQVLESGDPAVLLAYGLAVLTNVAILAAVAASLRETQSWPRFWALMAVLALSRLPGLLVRMEPRFLGVGLIVSLLVFLLLTERGAGRKWRRSVAVLLVASQFALLYAEVVVPRDQTLAMMQRAGCYFDMARDSVSTAQPDMVIVVNDDVAYYASRAMVQMASWPRDDVIPVVISSYEGSPHPAAYAEITSSGETVTIEARYGQNQRAFFAGALPEFDRPANGFTYSGVEHSQGPHAQAFVARGPFEVGRTLVLGADPSDGSLLVPTLY